MCHTCSSVSLALVTTAANCVPWLFDRKSTDDQSEGREQRVSVSSVGLNFVENNIPNRQFKKDGTLGIEFYKEPQLENSIMFCGWPGIGNIGITAIDTLRGVLRAREFAEIEPWDFFDPRKVLIKEGLLKDLEFPSSKFYFQQIKDQDLIFFIGEQQPSEGRTQYAEGQKAYEMANLVLDVAEKFDCRRVYTSGAAVAQIHHTSKSKVWAVPNSENLIKEVKQYENTILMSAIGGRKGQGFISGLNGLLLGIAKRRGLEAICVMGEIPYYLQVSLRKTSSNGNKRFRNDKIYESLIELVEVSGLAKAFLHNRLVNQQGVLRRLQKLPRYSKQLRGYTCDANLRERE